MLRYVPYALAVGLIVGLSVWQGFMTDRFVPSTDAIEMSARIENVPLDFGDWEGEDKDVDSQSLVGTNAVGPVISRIYINKNTKKRVEVWLICGKIEDMINHTPNICYPNSGFEQIGKLGRYDYGAGDEDDYFVTASFLRDTYQGREKQYVFWAWSAATPQWKGPDSPFKYRSVFRGNRAVYKMYFTTVITGGESIEDCANVEFGRDFLPVVTKALYPQEYQSAGGDGSDAAKQSAAEESVGDEPAKDENAASEG